MKKIILILFVLLFPLNAHATDTYKLYISGTPTCSTPYSTVAQLNFNTSNGDLGLVSLNWDGIHPLQGCNVALITIKVTQIGDTCNGVLVSSGYFNLDNIPSLPAYSTFIQSQCPDPPPPPNPCADRAGQPTGSVAIAGNYPSSICVDTPTGNCKATESSAGIYLTYTSDLDGQKHTVGDYTYTGGPCDNATQPEEMRSPEIPFPDLPPSPVDTDNDGKPNFADLDIDGDGKNNPQDTDADNDGQLNPLDITPAGNAETNGAGSEGGGSGVGGSITGADNTPDGPVAGQAGGCDAGYHVAAFGVCEKNDDLPPNDIPCPEGQQKIDGVCVGGPVDPATAEPVEPYEKPETTFDYSGLNNELDRLSDSGPVNLIRSVKNIASSLTVAGVAPVWSTPVHGQMLTIDLAKFNTIAAICRTLLKILMVVGLCFFILKQWRAG